jgi:hypothetical protein
MKNDHPIAGGKLAHVSANGGDLSGGFMSEDAGGRVGTGGNLFKVGTADATAMHSQKNFTVANLRDCNGLQPNVIDAAVNRSSHVGGNRASFLMNRELIGCSHPLIV